MTPILLIALALAAVLAWIFYTQPRRLVRWLARWNPEVLYYAETDKPVVALSIDDGPSKDVTPHILDVLGKHSARATFFVLGERAAEHPDLLAKLRRQGHELGNHLWSDVPSLFLGDAEFRNQLSRVHTLIGEDQQTKWFRPGSGWFDARMLAIAGDAGYRCCLASVYPHDAHVRSVRAIAWHALSHVYPGAIIVLHDGTPDRMRTVEALRIVIPELKRRGYRIETVSGMLRAAGEGAR